MTTSDRVTMAVLDNYTKYVVAGLYYTEEQD